MTKVAFFGLGAMGEPMAANLLKAGYSVSTAIHRSRDAAERLEKAFGLTIADDPLEAVQDAEYVITIIPEDADVKSFLICEDLRTAMRKDAVVIEMSSTMAQTVCEVERFYADRGIRVIDAPVSGGVTGAQKGTLTIFASGDEEAIEQAHPVLEAMGTNVFHLGKCGNGKAFKNLNNLLGAVNTMVMSEAFHIAQKNGLDMRQFFDVVSVSSGDSSQFRQRFLRMVDGEFEGGFQLKLARKDLRNALGMAQDVPTPLSALTLALMNAADPSIETEDMSAVEKILKI